MCILEPLPANPLDMAARKIPNDFRHMACCLNYALFLLLLTAFNSCILVFSAIETSPSLEPSEKTQLQDLHPQLLSHILHPRHGLVAAEVGALVTSSSSTLDLLSEHGKFYYYVKRHLGLDWKDASSSIRAFRNCQYLSQDDRIRLASIFGGKSTTTNPFKFPTDIPENGDPVLSSFCPLAVLELVENAATWWSGDDVPVFVPIPVSLRMTLAYHCCSLRDPYYLTILGTHSMGLNLLEALFYAESRVSIYHTLAQGHLTPHLVNGWNLSTLFLNSVYSSLPGSRNMMDLALIQNRKLILNFGISTSPNPGLTQMAVDKLESLMRNVSNLSVTYDLMLETYAQVIKTSVEDYRILETQSNVMDDFRRFISRLLTHGLDVNVFDNAYFAADGVHPMTNIIKDNALPILQVLVEYGLDVNQYAGGSCDLLVTAVSHWNSESRIVEYLLDLGVNTKQIYSSVGNILHVALNMFLRQSIDDARLIKHLILHGADPFAIHLKDGSFPIHRAIVFGKIATMDYLLHIDTIGPLMQRSVTQGRYTAFTAACFARHPEKVAPYFLGGYGGSLDWDSGQWDHCELLLLKHKHFDLLREVRRVRWRLNSADMLTYFARSCILSDSIVLLDILLQRGANIDEVDPVTGFTCLTYALSHANRDMVEFLVERNASLRSVSHHRHPSSSSFPEVILSWIKGLRRNPQFYKVTPIVAAAGAGSIFFHFLLDRSLEQGVDVFPSSQIWHAAIRSAYCHGHADVVQFLRATARSAYRV